MKVLNPSQSWLGDIPSNWEVKRIKDIGLLIGGAGFPHDFQGERDLELPFLKVVEIGSVESTEELTCASNTISRETAKKLGASIIRRGDIVFAKVGAALLLSRFRKIGTECCIDNNMMAFRPSPKILPQFALAALSRINFSDIVNPGAVPSINGGQIGRIEIALPPLETQQRIAAFLDEKTARIDGLIAKKRELLEWLAEKRQALITQAVTKGLNPDAPMKPSGIDWLGKIPAHWEVNCKLGFLAASEKNSFVNGPFGSDLLTSELLDEGVPVVYSGDVKASGFNRKSNKCVTAEKAVTLDFCRVDSEDVLLAKVGDPPGDACVYPTGSISGIVTQDVVRIRVDQKTVNPYFLSYLLISNVGRYLVKQVSVEATRGRFSLADLKGIRFPFPSIEEQEDVVLELSATLEKLNKVRELHFLSIEKLTEYRSALITAAVTGQVDLEGGEVC